MQRQASNEGTRQGNKKWMNDSVTQLSNKKYINLETYRKNGQPVQTPIWFVYDDGVFYASTDQNSGKIKRIQNNPYVRIIPCNFRGNPKGKWVDGQLQLASHNDSERVNHLLNQKYGVQRKILFSINKIRRTKSIQISIHLISK